jgi:hypothetical protein
MNPIRLHVIAWAMLISPVVDAAEKVNKCTEPTGKVVYQKEPCDNNQRGEEKQIDPNYNSIKMEIPPPPEKSKADTKPATPAPAPTAPAPRRPERKLDY